MSYFKTDEKERVGETLLECSDVSRTRSFSVFDGNNLTFRVEMGMDAFARSALLVPVKN